MPVDTTQLKGMAERLRRSSRQGDVLSLCDAVIAWQPERGVMPVESPTANRPVVGPPPGVVCPDCVKRREAKRLAMERWREKRDAGG